MVKPAGSAQAELWPALPYEAWKDTCTTLHLWTQIVGKIRLAQTPWINHSWHVTLYVTPRGLTTSPIPYAARAFQIDFDFIDHVLLIQTSDGEVRRLSLEPRVGRRVPRYAHGRAGRARHPGADPRQPQRSDRPDPVPRGPRACRLRSGVRAALLARAPAGGPAVQGVSHALSRQGQPGAFLLGQLRSCGDALFRAHGAAAPGRHPEPAGRGHPRSLFARGEQRRLLAGRRRSRLSGVLLLRLPDAPGLRRQPVRPQAAFFHEQLGEFILPYDAVRNAAEPDATLLDFLQTTYEAAANAANWDRAALEYGSGAATSVRRVAAHGAGAMPEARDGSFQRINEALPESVSGLGPRPGGPRQRSGRRGRRTRAAHLERFPERRSPPAGPG